MGIIRGEKLNKLSGIKEKITDVGNKAADKLVGTTISPSQLAQIEEKRNKYLDQLPDMSGEEAQERIRRNIDAISIEVNHAYLTKLKTAYLPIDISEEKFSAYARIRYFDITRWVYDSEENNLDKLVNVYHVLSEENCNIALIYQRTCLGCRVTLAVVNNGDGDPAVANAYQERISNAIKGNFPGIQICIAENNAGKGVPDALSELDGKSVAVVSNLSGEKSEKFISQSMEKLLDGFVPTRREDEYTIVLLASPICDQLQAKKHLADLYTALSPYANWQTNLAYSESEAIGSMAMAGFNIGVSCGVSVGVSYIAQVGRNYGINAGANINRGRNINITAGENHGVTLNFTNYTVTHELKLLEAQMERLEQCSALGMWDFAAYVISENPNIANNTAHMYLALTQGESSYLAQSAVNVWHGTQREEECKCILQSLARLRHPNFALREDSEMLAYPSAVDATTTISGKELAYSLNMPKKSVSGLPVIETVSFGREVQTLSPKTESDKIKIGQIYHMKQTEKTDVSLDIDSLCSHTFVTGSTGAGKSNTVYQLLYELRRKDRNFLVIEPAKGEYKNVFGGYSDVSVYGTNPLQSRLLELNPFSFHDSIHVLEHIDRLVEIFNACWPMYAAMPAVLKDAIEQSYRKKGWDLNCSVCTPIRFPTFRDLLNELPAVMEKSAYSADTKSDYSGALVTRVHSLTNGINGQVLCSGIMPQEESDKLFEKNAIVDLSRVGSSETKSLLMGILVMKLQEYRMHGGKMNASLSHVTVLEEAHNLLRRTSSVQSQEGANLQGKAVEMIANAIAEMRTYGEGFIIADQAPGLLDESIIRNTNTKIVLRLPDEADRVLVGKAMTLTDAQIQELTKLPVGVAAVFQNDWIQPVLCQFGPFPKEKQVPCPPYDDTPRIEAIKHFLYRVYDIDDSRELTDEEVDLVRRWLDTCNLGEYEYGLIKDCLTRKRKLKRCEKLKLTCDIFEGEYILSLLREKQNLRHVQHVLYHMYRLQDMQIVEKVMVYMKLAVSNQNVIEQRTEITEGRLG